MSLTLFVVSNIAGFLTAWLAPAADGRHVWVYDFAVLFSSFSTMLGYVVGAAALLWFALKWLGQVYHRPVGQAPAAATLLRRNTS